MKATDVRKDDFYLPTLELLRDLGGSASVEEIEEKLIERFGFSQEELDVTYEASSDNVIVDKMSWARSYLKFPAFVTNESRGVWVLTEAGRSALNLPVEEIRRQIRAAKANRRAKQLAERKAMSEDLDRMLAAESSDVGDEDAETDVLDWTDTLLATLKAMSPEGFERLAQRLLRESGFCLLYTSPSPRDS